MEVLLEALDYTLRYEKGNFQSGYCLLKDRQVAVVNKFFMTEARINSLVEIIGSIELPDIERFELDEKQQALLAKIRAKKTNAA